MQTYIYYIYSKYLKIYLQFNINQDLQISSDEAKFKYLLYNLIRVSIHQLTLSLSLKEYIEIRVSESTISNLLKIEIVNTGTRAKLNNNNSSIEVSSSCSNLAMPFERYNKTAQLLGPNTEIIITSKLGKGTKYGFLINKELQENNFSALKKSQLTFGEINQDGQPIYLKSINSSNDILGHYTNGMDKESQHSQRSHQKSSLKDLTVIARGEFMKVQFPDNDELNFSDQFSKNFSLNSENKEIEEWCLSKGELSLNQPPPTKNQKLSWLNSRFTQ
eukprot:TRINITY_DN19171_c0_g1_i1.p1 TRINITY_DN19171_c0_g1~~TRINITY_DN19171_c0_g1_i1.p1  ORF type:complete len:275 (+),score=34.59 TRINITY_DN19171_c0_g1_i1:303-1127(+)